jgi:hypothetical protein
MIINVANEFYKRPAGRVKDEGSYTGEHFREKFLTAMMKEAIDKKEQLIIDFTGTTMAGSSFLEESFGGLIRKDGCSKKDVLKYLEIRYHRPILKDRIIAYIKDAK